MKNPGGVSDELAFLLSQPTELADLDQDDDWEWNPSHRPLSDYYGPVDALTNQLVGRRRFSDSAAARALEDLLPELDELVRSRDRRRIGTLATEYPKKALEGWTLPELITLYKDCGWQDTEIRDVTVARLARHLRDLAESELEVAIRTMLNRWVKLGMFELRDRRRAKPAGTSMAERRRKRADNPTGNYTPPGRR